MGEECGRAHSTPTLLQGSISLLLITQRWFIQAIHYAIRCQWDSKLGGGRHVPTLLPHTFWRAGWNVIIRHVHLLSVLRLTPSLVIWLSLSSWSTVAPALHRQWCNYTLQLQCEKCVVWIHPIFHLLYLQIILHLRKGSWARTYRMQNPSDRLCCFSLNCTASQEVNIQ